ncbi:thermonuclease family protein [Pseudomonas sp. DTU_2021_1001937_2_SI_NGA_ILE_001]|uniref:thermonuclease family protein n=1 Tax=Pseudomonas sp. DTU_2021_1001937_2_SI_NGA_ILE_001 TaxID=3077589 RepID=UPI0028FC1871|nr:thermonuclease family protein [Pseudomonas sp. DTU_2021_1001937_2_SI_NGA_ILE_001]WNW12998.1 thermonuclease family protein [Pseudomonas sp. DTU_2021_1001937_2_SI_NGA_ILE_001]
MGIFRSQRKASLVGAFFVSVFWLGAAQAFCPAPAGLPEARVRQVIDGDTLRLSDGRSVRLIGIDTPELARRGKPAQPLAEAAKRRLQALVRSNGDRVRLRVGQQPKDGYGRTLAHVYGRDGSNFEAQLLSEGLGFRVVIAPNAALAGCQRAAERRARQARLGLWRRSPVLAGQQVRRPGFALVGGRVIDVRRNRGGVWLELDSVMLRVAPDTLRLFDAGRLAQLKGKRVEARGWIVERTSRGGLKSGQARWLMPLKHPQMLDILD